jgi:hypothetical protein
MEIGGLFKLEQDDVVLWPNVRLNSRLTLGTTFNHHPRLKLGEVLLLIDDPNKNPHTFPERVQVLSSRGLGWISGYIVMNPIV